jgi:hypothetical protein
MEQHQSVLTAEARIECLERRLRILRFTGALGLLGCFLVGYFAFQPRSASADGSGQVLRVRGLIVEDAQGRPRILIGAPVPKVTGRKREDDDTGIILVGENGADRVAIGSPTPAPQSRGKVGQRNSPGAGLVVDDLDGNERGGIGVLDNGRGVVCLDYPDPIHREAICLGVLPEGLAGLVINAPTGDNGERAMMAVLKDGTSLMKLADTSGNERSILVVQGESPAQFLVLDPKTKSKLDVLSKIKPE